MYLLIALGLSVLAIGCGKVGYKVFAIILGAAAIVSAITFFVSPEIPVPDLPDTIQVPGQ